MVPHRRMAARGRGFRGQAGRADRHRLDRHPGRAGDRGDRGAPHRVPAHRQLQRAGAQRAADAGVPALGERAIRGNPRHRADHRQRPRVPHLRAQGRRRDARRAARRSIGPPGRRAGCSFAPPSSTCSPTGPRTTPPRSSSRRAFAPSSRTRPPPRHLADIDHPYAAKRPPIDSDYFETFNRPNVSLVDLRADPIERITPTGIKTRSREHPLDIIVFATGFDALTGPLLKMDIQRPGGAIPARGLEGRAAKPTWACRCRVSPTCSRSPGRAARPCSPTCRWPSSSTSNGSPTASRTCAATASGPSSRQPKRRATGASASSRRASATLL